MHIIALWLTYNSALENENHFLRQAIQALLAITDRSIVATEELQQGFDKFQFEVAEVRNDVTSWGGHSAEFVGNCVPLLLGKMPANSGLKIAEVNRELAEWKAHYTNSAMRLQV